MKQGTRNIRIAILGLGAMGTALAQTLLNKGITPLVWNRSEEKTRNLSLQGAVACKTSTEAIVSADLIVLCLLDNGIVRHLLEPDKLQLEGKILINLTNGTPGQANDLAAWAESARCRYIDGGIMAIPPMIGSADALIIYSGNEEGFNIAAPFLNLFATSRFLGNDPGLAALNDLALLSCMYGLMGGFIHAAALLKQAELPARSFVPLATSCVSGMLPALEQLAEQIDTRTYEKDVVSNLQMQAVGYRNLLDTTEALAVNPALVAPMHKLMLGAIAKGFDRADLSAIIEVIA
ncbi:NAD(P)-dependent oxidoreductase [Pedobacter sp. SYP-B3415]|uniref:NAD(P)-dependent oxidoreductase n=1 Tax=Pedobacter sp. SYP-B3415 TaxID=2496641 RepID=UPI00101B9BC2|nr:NAD(P)-binding domain-containing protein [Pedobacter sp. SYP-B3415]